MTNDRQQIRRIERSAAHSKEEGDLFDCIVVGGGPAGLSAALYLGRMRRSVLVMDDDAGRSNWHQVNRNYLGFPDGIHAKALRELGEEQAKSYGVKFVNSRATRVEKAGDEDLQFHVQGPHASYTSRTLILATGVRDRFPQFEGSEECIGKSMYWCIICDGYEAIGKQIVVLGHNDRAAALALQLLAFTDNVVLVAWDEPFQIEERRLGALREHGVKLYNTACESFECSKGQISAITLETGEHLALDMVFVAQWMEPNTSLAKQLNLALDEHGFILTDSEQCTNVEGVYAAGDVTRLYNHQVTSAVHEGGMAAAAANYYLYEDWQKE